MLTTLKKKYIFFSVVTTSGALAAAQQLKNKGCFTKRWKKKNTAAVRIALFFLQSIAAQQYFYMLRCNTANKQRYDPRLRRDLRTPCAGST